MAVGTIVLSLILALIHPGFLIFFGFFGLIAVLFYGLIDTRSYLKVDVRHYHEKETRQRVKDLKISDVYLGEFVNQPVVPSTNSESAYS